MKIHAGLTGKVRR